MMNSSLMLIFKLNFKSKCRVALGCLGPFVLVCARMADLWKGRLLVASWPLAVRALSI